MSFNNHTQTMQYLQQQQQEYLTYPNSHNIMNQHNQNKTTYKYMTTKLIGSGTFGEIWNVIEKYDMNQQKQRRYAIKMIKTSRISDTNRRRKYEQIFINEGKRIIKLNNISTSEVGKHFIIQCRELLYCTSENNNNPILNLFSESPLIGPCIVMELCGYSLAQYMKFSQCTNTKISLSTIRCISAQIFFAMSFLHGIGACIHSDLKPDNILINFTDCFNCKTNQKILSKSPNIKIIDFGNAIDINRHKQLKSFNIQSLWYRSPEVLLGNFNEISSLMDMWSIGCILFELTSLTALNNGSTYARKRLFACKKLNPADVVYKIGEKLSPFPQYIYNQHKSFHYVHYNAVNAHISTESSYIKLKNERNLQLINNLQFNEKNKEFEEEFMCLIDLLSCLLDLNPLTRYTSEDAIRHKFTVYNYTNNDCIQHKMHPIIKSCDDKQRQNKINIQISEINEYVHCNLSTTSQISESFPITIAKQHL